MSPMLTMFLLLALANLIQWQFGSTLVPRLAAAAPLVAFALWYWFAGGRSAQYDEPLWLELLALLAFLLTLIPSYLRYERDLQLKPKA